MGWELLRKLNTLAMQGATAFLGIYPTKVKTYAHRKTCIRMFIAPLVIIAKTWKLPRCPSVGEEINKLVHPDDEILCNDKKE